MITENRTINEIRNEAANGGADVSELTFVLERSRYGAEEKARSAGVRLLQSAALLPDGGTIGVQADAAGMKYHVFSNPVGCVLTEDHNWIFDRCAKATEDASGFREDLFSDNRRVYALTCTKEGGSVADDRDGGSLLRRGLANEQTSELYREMLRMMKEADATVRVTAGARRGIAVSLPGEMPFRMKSLLAIVFPGTEAVAADPEDGGFAPLPDDVLLDCVIKLLIAALSVRAEKDGAGDDYVFEDIGDADPLEDRSCDGNGRATPIEELDLSIRAYNCLRRAGVDSVEKLKTLSDGDLARVRNLGKKCIDEIRQKLKRFACAPDPIPSAKGNCLDALNEMIGLDEVKDQIAKITALARMKKELSDLGAKDVPINLNMEFVGNPGTAKTTVARLVAGILYEIGLLKSGEAVEVGRSDLVAEYVGQTAVKVREVFQRAKGRLLFIDEAYSLLDDRKGEFGDEAIHAIVQEMENRRDDTVVIFAGYPKEMRSFFERNPGFRSRVPFRVEFRDYSAPEMVKIARAEAKKRGFTVSKDACARIESICSEALRDPSAGNGRFCRNLIERSILSFASRTFGPDGAFDGCRTLLPEDFSAPENVGTDSDRPVRIGFCA